MKVLSLFDGMACGYEALLRAGIQIEKYYASEIDKYAIQIATKNHPDIIEIGDVQKVWYSTPDRDDGGEYLVADGEIVGEGPIDLLIGGSPCQGFSVAGKMLNFNDPRSKLFFEFVRLKNEIKPKYFLLENVKMKKEWQDIISEYLGVQPIEINSALVSAQNRRRLYWTNIPGIQQPQDKGILLKDILQKEVDDKYVYTEERRKTLVDNPHNHDILKRTENVEGKCNTLTTVTGGNQEKKICIQQIVKVRKYVVDIEGLKAELRQHKTLTNKEIAEQLQQPITKVEHWFRNDNCFAIPDAEIRYKLKELLGITTDKFDASITEFEERPGVYEKAERKISVEGKMTTLTTSGNDEIIYGVDERYYLTDKQLEYLKSWGIGRNDRGIEDIRTGDEKIGAITSHCGSMCNTIKLVKPGVRIRKLTPIECERLQTLPDNYTEGVSDSQRYKMLGNGWTVEVIAHIFRNMNTGGLKEQPLF